MYERTTKAAVANAKSLKDLAEALALDIPKRRSGPTNDSLIRVEVIAARSAIIAAGGEERNVSTLMDYRAVASWVQPVNRSNSFDWIEGASFTLHREAYAAGWTLSKLGKEYANGITVAQIRESQGRQGHGFETKDRSQRYVDAWSTIIAGEHDIEHGDWVPNANVDMARHFGMQFVRNRSELADDVVDQLVDDIDAFLAAQQQ